MQYAIGANRTVKPCFSPIAANRARNDAFFATPPAQSSFFAPVASTARSTRRASEETTASS